MKEQTRNNLIFSFLIVVFFILIGLLTYAGVLESKTIVWNSGGTVPVGVEEE